MSGRRTGWMKLTLNSSNGLFVAKEKKWIAEATSVFKILPLMPDVCLAP